MSTVKMRRGYQRLAGVNYDDYVRMRQHRCTRHLRMAYHDGILEIVSPPFRDDRGGRRLYNVINAYAGAFDVPCDDAASTTFSTGVPGEPRGKGREPDESFCIGDVVQQIIGNQTLNLDTDPPPSLWIEVDNWGSSASNLPLYAGRRVSEVWRYRVRRRKLWFGRLAGDTYESIDRSVVLPGLTPEIVLHLLALGARTPSSAWSKWLLTERFPTHREELGV
jgi:hypothetical protein